MSLVDKLLNVQQKRPNVGTGDQTAAVQQAQQAARGRVGTARGPRGSNLGERVAVADATAQGRQLQQDAQVQALGQQQQQAQQEQRFTQQTANIAQGVEQARQNFANQANQISSNLERSKRQTDSRRQISDIASAGQAYRFQNQKYLDDLQREAQRRGLDDQQAFELELQKATFAHRSEMFEDDAEFARMMQADDQEFAEMMAQRGANFAIEMANRDKDFANRSAAWTAGTSILAPAVGSALTPASDNTGDQ